MTQEETEGLIVDEAKQVAEAQDVVISNVSTIIEKPDPAEEEDNEDELGDDKA